MSRLRAWSVLLYPSWKPLVPPTNNPAPHPPYKEARHMQNAYVCFVKIHQPEDGHKRRNM